MLTPRPYQSRVVEDLWNWFDGHQDGHPVIEACVGAGKSMIIAMIAQRAMSEFPGTRILVIVPSKELLQQNLDELYKVWPEADAGVYSAAVKKKELGKALTYATIGSVYKRAAVLGRVDMILADECHGISTKDTGMWRGLISDLQRYGSPVRVVGLTGTPFRGNGAWLTHGEDPLFTHICTRVTIKELLGLGFLSPLTTIETKTHIDTSDVKTVGGDYVVSDLARATDKDELVQAACDEIVVMGAKRRRWLVFCVTVEHAEHVTAALRQRGVAAAVVTGDTPPIVRERIIDAHRTGRIRCLVNVAIATTGYNVKEIDFLVLLRATKSPVLYTQILGRGLRIADGKTDCLVADFTDTILTLGPVDEIKGKVPGGKRKSEAPHKICESCGNPNPTAVLKCIDCGAPFPEPERINHSTTASAAAVLSNQRPKFDVVEVEDVVYRLHNKAGSVSSLRIDYRQGLMYVATEWVCIGHSGFPRRKAESWWSQRCTINQIPKDAEEAIAWLEYDKSILRVPARLTISRVGKYPEIVSYDFTRQASLEGPQDRLAA